MSILNVINILYKNSVKLKLTSSKINRSLSTMAELRFNDRVAVVTGAGAGLGRAYALLFASRGAKVVVNDLGGGRHGEGKSSTAADSVVDEIRKNGGTAVPDYNSVVEGDKIIKTALDNFGRVDIVVNNAGILRDKSFARISDQDWDLIHAVHLKGSFKTTQAAWPIFKKQNYGRIIMTASNSGVYGNFGQANYSAAKLGLIGLSNTLAIEGAKNNIHCNVIVPTAASRLTEDILPPDLFKELKPEYIAPVVAYLCHESCEDNGAVIESALGWAGKIHNIRSPGGVFRTGDSCSIEEVQKVWPQIVDMSKARHLESIQEATAELISVLNGDNSSELKTIAKSESSPNSFAFDSKNIILYALGVGASVKNPEHMRYLYENHEDFQPLPGYFVIPGLMIAMTTPMAAEAIPHAEVSPVNILHGEQYLEITGKLPTEGNLRTEGKIVDVLDKGSGAVVILNFDTYNGNEHIVKSQMTVFVVGAGNFGGKRTSTSAIAPVEPPSRAPDTVVEEPTTMDSAALYRLSGDMNPLHIDSGIAKIAGFKRPILHGLCTVGYSIRHIIEQYSNGDSSNFKSYKVRFSKPVLPGQTLKTLMWREGNRIHFETEVKETGIKVITGAYVDLKDIKMTNSKSSSGVKLESDAIFQKIIDGVKAEPAKAKSVNGVFLYKITQDGKEVKKWTLDLKTGEVYEGEPKSGIKVDTTLTIADSDMVDLAFGKLQPQAAYMRGKLKIAGNIMLTQKLVPLLKDGPKL